MAALTAARNTPQEGVYALPVKLSFPVKAGAVIYPGAQVALSAGFLVPASVALGLLAVGRADGMTGQPHGVADNTLGNDGDISVDVSPGTFKWANGTSTDTVAQADVGSICYMLDDQTVVKTDGNGARSPAGRVVAVDSSGVQVTAFVGISANVSAAGHPAFIVSMPVKLKNSVNAGIAARFTPSGACRILKSSFVVSDPAIAGSKLGTLQPKIAGTSVTGGALALTSSNCDTLGKEVAGTAVTAANEVAAGVEVTLVWASVTAFVEGEGMAFLHFG